MIKYIPIIGGVHILGHVSSLNTLVMMVYVNSSVIHFRSSESFALGRDARIVELIFDEA